MRLCAVDQCIIRGDDTNCDPKYYCKYKLPMEVVRAVKGSKSRAVTATVCSLRDTGDVKKAAGYIKDSALYIYPARALWMKHSL